MPGSREKVEHCSSVVPNRVCGVTDHHKASYTHEEVMRAIRAIDAAHLKRKNDQDAPNKLTAKEVCASTLLGKGRSCGCRLQRTMLPHGVLIMHARDAVHYARALICWCPPVMHHYVHAALRTIERHREDLHRLILQRAGKRWTHLTLKEYDEYAKAFNWGKMGRAPYFTDDEQLVLKHAISSRDIIGLG